MGGKRVPIEEYPYIVSLQGYGDHFCAGVILTKDYILTAAHCAKHLYSTENFLVRAGLNHTDEEGTYHYIQGVS